MRGKILVIEDEMAINDLISMNLEVTGYEVVSCLDGLEAEETLKKEADFDLALVDIMLPGKDGFALLPELKAAGIPVIFLTAKADVQSKVRGLKESIMPDSIESEQYIEDSALMIRDFTEICHSGIFLSNFVDVFRIYR